MGSQRGRARAAWRWAGGLRSACLLALVAALAAVYGSLAPPGLSGQATSAEAAPTALAYTQSPCAPVRTAPSATAPLITQLLGGTDVTLLDTATPGWSHIRI
jgi:hypothetical protein